MADAVPYLLQLAERLGQGLNHLPESRRDVHSQFILSRQYSDGGFMGREGESDLYYTGFAARTLAILGTMTPSVASRLTNYLKQQSRKKLTVIDLLSWLYSAVVAQAAGGDDILGDHTQSWPDRLAEMLEAFRAADGGYRKTEEGAAGSMYHSFLVLLCYQLINRPLPHPRRLIQFVFDRQRDDGGFAEIAPMKRGGTNPTAAAAAILNILGGLDDQVRSDLAEFLSLVKGSEGGFLANSRIPFCDGLSTFTGLLTVQDLKLPIPVDPIQVATFINSLEVAEGGFRGASWDTGTDVEYTFYSLGVLALVGRDAARNP